MHAFKLPSPHLHHCPTGCRPQILHRCLNFLLPWPDVGIPVMQTYPNPKSLDAPSIRALPRMDPAIHKQPICLDWLRS